MSTLKYTISAAICAMAALTGCSTDEIDTFSGGAQVYFERAAGSGTADSLTYSFAVQPADLMVDIVEIPKIGRASCRERV